MLTEYPLFGVTVKAVLVLGITTTTWFGDMVPLPIAEGVTAKPVSATSKPAESLPEGHVLLVIV
jgi:hypothetical protein